MIQSRKLWELFEYAWLMMRQNPGGKSAYLQGYLLGFAGEINILDALDPVAKTGEVKLKTGNGEVQAKTVDFSAAGPAELTPKAAATALNGAGFADCAFSVDPETNRLKLAPTSPGAKLAQIYGGLAAALRFGNCRSGEGKGCYLWASMDGDLKSAAETEEWGEDKKIENDSPEGQKVTYTIPGSRGGTQLVLTDRLDSREAKQMINGGTWIRGDADNPDVYEPPASAGDPARVDVLTFSKLMGNYSNTPGSEVLIRERLYVGASGRVKHSGGAGIFYDSEYTLTCGSYTGDDGQERGSPRETDYTISQWEALNLASLVVPDWEAA